MTDDNGPEQTFRDTERNLRNTIETQAREIERLREALDWMEYTEPGVVDAIRMRVARAALGESHDQ